MKKLLAILMALVFTLSVTGCDEDNKQTSSNSSSSSSAQATEQKQAEQTTEENNPPPVEEKASKNYDTLQTIFAQISITTKPSDIESIIANNNLTFTKQEYNGTPKQVTYKIAYDKDVALQKHGKDGDNLSISFNVNDGSVMTIEYHKNLTTALLYNYGTHWDFREKNPNNQYSGYYYQLDAMKKDGIEIKYSNGNTKKTSYHRTTSADIALSSIL